MDEGRQILTVGLDGSPIFLDEFGDTIGIKGLVFERTREDYDMIFLLPRRKDRRHMTYKPTESEWKEILKNADVGLRRVTDLSGRVTKGYIKKSLRQIDEHTRWAVYKRDKYRCVYCGRSGIPMTVDHYIPQEKGGETTMENLRTSCRECNRLKGNMMPKEWENEKNSR